MAAKKKYLTYLEDTRKHHPLIEKVAQTSAKKAIAASLSKSIPVTYMEGENIVNVGPKGKKSIVGTVKNNRRKVKVGAKTKLSKK